jgi:stage III sporulation protein AA
MWQDVEAILPHAWRTVLQALPRTVYANVEEIRLRLGRPLEIVYGATYGYVTLGGMVTMHPHEGVIVAKTDMHKWLERLADYSFYTVEEEMRAGYLTMPQGHRVGLVGQVTLEHGRVRTFKHIAGCNIRLARHIPSNIAPLLPLLQEGTGYVHTLIVSPPQYGKTTLLRELARTVASPCVDATWRKEKCAVKVGIVDERSELAACIEGIPTRDVGTRTDVLDRCPKAQGMMMLIRTMSPDVLMVDEIGDAHDAAAVAEAMHAGVTVMASAHGRDVADVQRRVPLRPLFSPSSFQRFIVLQKEADAQRIVRIFDATQTLLGTMRLVPTSGMNDG